MQSATFHEKAEAAQEILSNKMNIRRFLKHFDIQVDELGRFIKRLDSIRGEIEEEAKKEEEERKEKLLRAEEAKSILREKGLTLEELLQIEQGNGVPRKRRGGQRADAGKKKYNPKGIYEYEDENGNKKEITMPRVGRAPAEFSDYLKRSGKKRKDCLVKELDEQSS